MNVNMFVTTIKLALDQLTDEEPQVVRQEICDALDDLTDEDFLNFIQDSMISPGLDHKVPGLKGILKVWLTEETTTLLRLASTLTTESLGFTAQKSLP